MHCISSPKVCLFFILLFLILLTFFTAHLLLDSPWKHECYNNSILAPNHNNTTGELEREGDAQGLETHHLSSPCQWYVFFNNVFYSLLNDSLVYVYGTNTMGTMATNVATTSPRHPPPMPSHSHSLPPSTLTPQVPCHVQQCPK